MNQRPTIKDVAREANVSHATVSYILSGNPHAERISPETKDRVWNAVRHLGYQFNPIGRALKRGYTNQIILLIVTWNLAKSHSATAMSVSRAAAEHEFDVTVHVADSDNSAEMFLKRRMLANIGGILVLWDSPALQHSYLLKLAEDGLPVVDLLPDGPDGFCVVTADREDAGYKVTQHLISLGHRRIGVICDTTSRAKTTLRKLAGYRRALTEAGIDYDAALLENTTEFGFEGGYQAFLKLFERQPDLTSIFCINDPMAIGALAAASEMGMKCPEQLSVAGYGASPEGEYWRPRLTTVELSPDKVAARAIQIAGERRKQPDAEPETVLIPGDLIIRDSTGPISR